MTKASDGGTLTQRTVGQITDYIHDHDLRAGDQIPSEGEFGKLFGVSRSVTREAFKILSALQIIDIGGGRRARVGSLDGANLATFFHHGVRIHQFSIQQVWDARRAIALRAVELACLHRTEKEADHLISLAQQMKKVGGNVEESTRIDIEFHNSIADYSRNPLFSVMMSSCTSSEPSGQIAA